MLDINSALYWFGFWLGFGITNAAIVLSEKLPEPLLPFPIAIILTALMVTIPLSVARMEFTVDEIIEGSKRGILSGFAFYLGQVIAENFIN